MEVVRFAVADGLRSRFQLAQASHDAVRRIALLDQGDEAGDVLLNVLFRSRSNTCCCSRASSRSVMLMLETEVLKVDHAGFSIARTGEQNEIRSSVATFIRFTCPAAPRHVMPGFPVSLLDCGAATRRRAPRNRAGIAACYVLHK